MDSTRWDRIQTIFHQAADLSEPERTSFLNNACCDDAQLQTDIVAMLNEDARASSLLDQDPAQVAHQILDVECAPTHPHEQLGPYRVMSALGEGGMGVVYLAQREDLGNLVAIKLLRDAWLSPARRERFASEQRLLAQLNHPSIAKLYDADTLANGTPFFVMEYVEGVPLTDYCRHNACSIDRRLQLFRAVCEAVQYAHGQAVIHRDLKPSNILVKGDGSVRLLDFGIAKQVESLEPTANPTLTGLRMMTPAYASPEQIRGDRVGVQSDVYSLGVILYELLAGGLPFDIANLPAREAEEILLEREPAKPSAVARQTDGVSAALWADLDVLCLTAMHRDPGRRYRSVEAVMRDVDHYLAGEPLEARPDSVRYRLRKFVTRNSRAVAATSLAVLLIISLVAFFTISLARARNDALAEAARTQRIQRFTLDLFKGGDEVAGPSEQMRVATLLDRGVKEAQLLSAEPQAQADLYETLGTIYQKLAKFDRADSLLQSSLDERKKLFSSDSRQVAETIVLLALLKDDEGKYEDAEKLARQGLDMSQRHLPPNDPQVAKATFALGKVLEARGHYPDAIDKLNYAAQLQTGSAARQADLAASLSELANTNFYAGHYDASEALNQRVLKMQREIFGERHPQVADTLINLGAIQFQLGRYADSERYYRQALEIVEEWYGNQHPDTADAMTFVGQALTNQKRFDEAADMLKQSRAILVSTYGPMHQRVAFADNELGNVALRQGKLDDAEGDFQEALNIYRTVYNNKHYQMGITQCNLGGVYLERKDYLRAEQFVREALQTYSSSVAPDHYNVGIAHIRLGAALIGQHRYHDAEQESLAGYDILRKKANPNLIWIQNASKDLVQIYDALGEPDKAAKFRGVDSRQPHS
jgi:serine/threonine protein kinase